MNPINTNTAAINAQYNLSKVQSAMDDAMSALSSGKRITSAADDAAGLSIVTRMESQVRGLNQAMRNAADGQSMVDTAEGAMDEIANMLQRMRELALQAANGSNSANDRANLDAEVDQLKAEIDRIVGTTTFNDKNLLNGAYKETLQIGANANETLGVSIGNMSTSALGIVGGAVSDVAAVTASATGTAAIENVAQLTFNGNDTYGFKLVLSNATGAGATNKEIDISASVTANSAEAVAKDINDKLSNTGGVNLTGILTAQSSGNVVTITAKDGAEIDISAFTSSGNGTMTVNQVTNASAASKTLENVTEVNNLRNTNNTPAVKSAGVLQLDVGKKYSFLVNNTQVTYDGTNHVAVAAAIDAAIEATSGVGTATVVADATLGTNTKVQFDFQDTTGARVDISGFQKLTSPAVAAGTFTVDQDIAAADATYTISGSSGNFSTDGTTTAGNVLSIAATKTGTVSFSNQDLAYTFDFDGVEYTVDGKTQDFMAELTRVAAAISAATAQTVQASNDSGVLKIVNGSAAALKFEDAANAVGVGSAPGISEVTAGTAFYKEADTAGGVLSAGAGITTMENGTAVTATGTEAVASQMSLDIKGDDRYTFKIDHNDDGTGDVTVIADVVGGSLTAMINAVNAHTSTTGVTAKLDAGLVVLEKAAGTQFRVTNFSSEAEGKIVAANAVGQGGAATLENAGDGQAVQIASSGAAVATQMDVEFTSADSYSFQISDGTSVAVVRSTAVGADNDTTTGDNDANNTRPETGSILTEIQSALNAANMSHITASASEDVITLKNTLGGDLNIENFKSTGTGKMNVATKSGQGVGRILDDNGVGGTGSTINGIDTSTASAAQAALDVIDRALENISSERSKLGAISNRLDHTISNLGNIVVNTEAAQSRIEDADFAAETGNLTKAQILSQAATAMLAQANASKQSVLSLLQG